MTKELTNSQEKYFRTLWYGKIMKLSELETNSPEYISTYDRILTSLKKTHSLTLNPNNEEFSRKHKSAEDHMNIIEHAVRYNNYPKIGAMI